MRSPLSSLVISSPFGYRTHPVTGQRQSFHNGVDYKAKMGEPIYAPCDGVVSFSKHPSGGTQIILTNPGGLRLGFAHLSKYAEGLRNGDRVERGQVIGYVGDTGRVTGPHLHFTASVVLNGSKKFFDPTIIPFG